MSVGARRSFDWDEACRLKDAGAPITDIAARLGVTPNAVYIATARGTSAKSSGRYAPMPRKAKVERARTMHRDGARWQDIAATFGVSIGTVGNWLKAKQCSECDDVVTRPGSQRCASCAAKNSHSLWTEDRILYAIRKWFVEHGVAPSAIDWSITTENTPDYNHVARRFGSFNAGILAAGFTPRRPGGRGGDIRDRKRLAIPRTVGNGFTAEEELAYLVEQQTKDERSGWRVFRPSVDGLESRFRHDARSVFSDGWVHVVHHVVDRRREIDAYADEWAA